MEVSNSLGTSESPPAQVPWFGGFHRDVPTLFLPSVHSDCEQNQGITLNGSAK